MEPIRLTEKEEGFCQDIAAGLDPLTSFRRNYKGDKRKDNKARYQAKLILAKDKIANRIKCIRDAQNFDGDVTAEQIKAKAWEWVNRFPGKPAGIAALNLLAKEKGVGVEKLIIEDASGVVDLQRNLFARRMAMINGEEIPPLLDTEDKKEEATILSDDDYEVIDDEDDEDNDYDDDSDTDDDDELGDFEWDV